MDLKKALQNVSLYQPILMQETQASAAVMVILLTEESPEMLEIVITKRAQTLSTYAGHYSFPGGFKESQDKDLYKTVEREIQEELFIKPEHYQLMGQADDFVSKEGHLVRPFITHMQKKQFLRYVKTASDEIESLLLLPVEKITLFVDSPRYYQLTKRRPSYIYQEQDICIWGLTANLLVHIDNILFNKNRPLGKTLVKSVSS